MQFKIVPHFEEIFPDEEKLDAIDYLIKIPKEILLKSIGFCNTQPLPNHNNFFSNPTIAKEISFRVNRLISDVNDRKVIEIISPHSYLKLSEIVFSNIDKFNDQGDPNTDGELNLFKAFLVLNSRFKEYKHDFEKDFGIDNFIDFLTLQSFQLSEISISSDDKLDLIKLVYATIYKVESILNFLTAKKLEDVKIAFIKSFDMVDEKEFLYQMKYLFATLFIAKYRNQYIFTNENFSSFSLVKNISVNNISEDEDFTGLKKTPIYFLDENRFSIINFFFVVDLFYRSAKFRLREIFAYKKINVGDFFSYYNKEFSENFLMKNVLDDLFSKKYFIKKIQTEQEKNNEPDYYVNYNNNIILFENKDVLINKLVKSATEIETINNFLYERFVQSTKKDVGVKQLANSIESIYKNNFQFDGKIIYKKKIEIFPVLVVHDRIFQSMGINYKLNVLFRKELNERNIISSNNFTVHGLTIFDIDTLILWNKNIQNNFKLLKELLIKHTKHMEEKQRTSYDKQQHFEEFLQRILKPISSRNTPFFINKTDFRKQFLDLSKK